MKPSLASDSAYQMTTYWRGWNKCLPNDNPLAMLERALFKGQPTGDAGTRAYRMTTYWQGWNECIPNDNLLARLERVHTEWQPTETTDLRILPDNQRPAFH
ncbi:hypothetical protein EGW08_018746 [Elysia chlorotica]|uniref:Uncharacterized protein n=1 Tax=Elysia chlorotica TaxID=188477 RepID=A0A433SW43_ELYCH|nr:hypothetical protein EGW08_018746 [Elysia chlorotica]